jgi:hypothetical protein
MLVDHDGPPRPLLLPLSTFLSPLTGVKLVHGCEFERDQLIAREGKKDRNSRLSTFYLFTKKVRNMSNSRFAIVVAHIPHRLSLQSLLSNSDHQYTLTLTSVKTSVCF